MNAPLSPTDFDAFFAAVNGGHSPYSWQRRLLDFVVEHGRWPERIEAPTGAGKSCVVEVHLFVNALAASRNAAVRPPRRLVSVVGRRALVDAMERRARRVLGMIAKAPTGSIAAMVGNALELLTSSASSTTGTGPVLVTSLRGGIPLDYAWRDDPSACQIICATPDMWGSSALFHGYGSSPRARSRDAGILTYDTVAILDEAHLNRQLAATARRIAELTSAEPLAAHLPALQFVEMTATHAEPGSSTSIVRLEWDELSIDGQDHSLSSLLCRPKPLEFRPVPEWPIPRSGRNRTAAIAALIDAVQAARESAEGTVGCILNRVDDALDLHQHLVATGVVSVCLVGRMREMELRRLQLEHPGLLSPIGDPTVEVLVATQTLEVGVDLDLHALVTELAPAAALAQRAGRVNRLGARPDGPVTVIVPEHPSGLADRSGRNVATAPYQPQDLVDAHRWLTALAKTSGGVNPAELRRMPPGAAAPRRLAYSTLEFADVDLLAATSESLFSEPDLTFWLRDELEEAPMVNVVARTFPAMGVDSAPSSTRDVEMEAADLELLAAAPPLGHELYPCRPATARAFLEQFGEDSRTYVWNAATNTTRRYRGRIRVGDIIIVPAGIGAGVSGGTITEIGTGATTDVMGVDVGQGEVRYLLLRETADATPLHELFTTYDELCLADSPVTVGAFDSAGAGEVIADAARHAGVPDGWVLELRAPSGTSTLAAWLLLVANRPTDTPEEIRETWSTSRTPVTLDAHQAAVGERGGRIAASLALPTDVSNAVVEAGRWHDAGKADPRFQTLLRGRPAAAGEMLLAKSPGSRGRFASRRLSTTLPAGWRHEQLSAVHYWTNSVGAPQPHRDLITRLVGTSHGVGRTTFPHSAEEIVPVESRPELLEAATELFDQGEWDDLIERTHRAWGLWGCAVLEAVVRAADGQVSKEGS